MKSKLKIKKDDRVLVATGREKGKVGKVLKVIPDKGRVIVEKVNMIKRHTKAGGSSQGGIVEKEAPLAMSNLRVLCPKCNEPGRVSRQELSDGKTARYCKKCDEFMDS